MSNSAARQPATVDPISQTPEPLSVLVVDDDELFAQLVQRILKRDNRYHYNITIADCATSAIDLCSDIDFDICLIDYHLPDMSGLDCLEAIGQTYSPNDYLPPVILCTASGNEKVASDALRADVDDYIPKSHINASSISRAIHQAVTKARLKQANTRQFVELVRINKELEQKQRETSRFYQNISHEVKTPLASAREFISLVRDGVAGDLNEQQAELLDYALSSCDQLTRHFDDLVDIIRLDLQKLPLKKSSFEVSRLLKNSVASCEQAIRKNNGSIELEYSTVDKPVYADEHRIIQVLSNLIGNAVKYSPGEPDIKVVVSVENNHFTFCVSDKGSGISEADIPNVFEKLYQSGTATNECLGAGIGLGLSIAKEIVELHGGSIWLTSKQGVGSDFYFTLPVAS